MLAQAATMDMSDKESKATVTQDGGAAPASAENETLAQWIKGRARDSGFELVGISPATIGLGAGRLMEWLACGKQGEMTYMAEHAAARSDPSKVLRGVKSVVMVALGYRSKEPAPRQSGFGRMARYAWGADYHDVMHVKLEALRCDLVARNPAVRARCVVDSAPLMERDYAQLAGLGWIGKNTLLLNRELGSWFFLGALLIDCELDYDLPHSTDHCGSCTKCLDACPTSAFDGPYQLDPRRCISYLTIEHKSAIPESQRPLLGDWIFGCDVCQDVCPWNGDTPVTSEPRFFPAADANPIDLASLLQLDDAAFRRRFRGTPLFRAKIARVLRNAAIVAGNQRAANCLPALKLLCDHSEPAVRVAVHWAIARIETTNESGPPSCVHRR